MNNNSKQIIPNTNTCVVCGREIPEGFMLCNDCGHIKTSDRASRTNETTKK